MSIPGSGIAPASGAVFNELTSVTRRGFVPRLFVQIYQAAPILNIILRNAQRAQGGMNPITVPVQGSAMTTFGWTGYSGGFQQPSIQPGISNAQFNMSLGVVPIPILGPEAMAQTTEAVIPLLRARCADARTQIVQQVATAAFGTITTDPTQQQINGLIDAYDDGTTTGTYGGLARATNAFWKGNRVTTSFSASRQNIAKQIMFIQTKAGGEAPDLVIMSPSDWTTLVLDYMNSETFFTTPDSKYGRDNAVNAGFSAVQLNNTPIIADPFCPKGTMFVVNTRYLSGYIAESANFAFSGFYSLIPNNILGQVGVLALGMQLTCAKPSSGGYYNGLTGGAF